MAVTRCIDPPAATVGRLGYAVVCEMFHVDGRCRQHGQVAAYTVLAMERPTRFEDYRWLGDKRTQVVHDVDACTAPEVIRELLEAETFLCFGPDTLAEARNRGYRACRRCDGMRAPGDDAGSNE